LGTQFFRYALGYSEKEARRLQVQAALSEDILEYGLGRGGLRNGMHVLDLGSGVGDVALCASRIVGPGGSVTGIERWSPSLEIARTRVADHGLTNVRFVQSELDDFEPDRAYDAIIGRFILQYLPDRARLLSRLKHSLRSGGVVIFQEIDNSGASQYPPSVLFEQVNTWITTAFKSTGAVYDMGALLPRTFLAAGLPRPEMISMGRVESGPDTPFYEFLTDVLRSVMPVLEKIGAATQEEVELDTLADRLRQDAVAEERTLYSARIVTAWTGAP
jgi:ubiquinone/menaquinone biosynthesis C-methylase UbiE